MNDAIEQLEKIIRIAKDCYYEKGRFARLTIKEKFKDAFIPLVNYNKEFWLKKPSVVTIDDETYDLIEETYKKLKPKATIAIGSPVTTKVKVDLPFFMGSLDKVSPNTLESWLSSNDGPYIIMDKLDGLSIGITHKTGKYSAYTRGNGSVGQNITHLVPFLKLPNSPYSQLRGEIIIAKDKFDKNWKSDFENPRNMAAGIVNRKDLHPALADINAVIYEVINPRGVPSTQLKHLKELGFNVVPFKVFKSLTVDIVNDYYTERRAKSKFDIDGLVIMLDKRNQANTSGNPDFAVAYKDNSKVESAIADVVKVEWNASKHGKLAPVVIVEADKKPLRLSGTNVSRVSAFNAKFINDNKIGPGAKVEVRKRGDIIPYIEKVIKGTKAQLPKVEEFGDYEWNDTKVDLVISEPLDNEDVAVKQLTHFFRTLGVENFSGGLVARFYENGFDTIPKIIKMTKSDMLSIDGIQDKMAEKIYSNIKEALSEVYLPSLMDASGIFGRNFGTRRVESIFDEYYPDIMNWDKLKPLSIKIKVLKIHGFQETLAKQFADNLHKFFAWFKPLKIKYFYNEYDEDNTVSDKLKGHKIYITGFRDSELSSKITENGGEESGFSSKTTILIVKDSKVSNSKTIKAKEMGILVLNKNEFISRFKL